MAGTDDLWTEPKSFRVRATSGRRRVVIWNKTALDMCSTTVLAIHYASRARPWNIRALSTLDGISHIPGSPAFPRRLSFTPSTISYQFSRLPHKKEPRIPIPLKRAPQLTLCSLPRLRAGDGPSRTACAVAYIGGYKRLLFV